MSEIKLALIGGEKTMNTGLQSALAIAAMLGIGGGIVAPEASPSAKKEPRALPSRDEAVERIVARSRGDQERKKARRKARWNKSQKGKNR